MKRTRLRSTSEKMTAILQVYRLLKHLLAPHFNHCARCQAHCTPDIHHPYKRGKGRFSWKLFCIIPLCRVCHEWVHTNENQARKDGWLVEPKYHNPYDLSI